MSELEIEVSGMESIAVPDVGQSTILLQVPYEAAKCTVVAVPNGENSILYNVLLYDEITEPKDYMSLFRICTKSRETDVIKIAFETIGGSVTTAVAIATALSGTKAKVIKIALGDVMSAGTLLCDGTGHIEIGEYAHFMYHMSSSGLMGNTKAVIEGGKQIVDYIEDYLKEAVETGCITSEELDLIVNKRQDVYVVGQEMAKRLNKDIYK